MSAPRPLLASYIAVIHRTGDRKGNEHRFLAKSGEDANSRASEIAATLSKTTGTEYRVGRVDRS